MPSFLPSFSFLPCSSFLFALHPSVYPSFTRLAPPCPLPTPPLTPPPPVKLHPSSHQMYLRYRPMGGRKTNRWLLKRRLPNLVLKWKRTNGGKRSGRLCQGRRRRSAWIGSRCSVLLRRSPPAPMLKMSRSPPKWVPLALFSFILLPSFQPFFLSNFRLPFTFVSSFKLPTSIFFCVFLHHHL